MDEWTHKELETIKDVINTLAEKIFTIESHLGLAQPQQTVQPQEVQPQEPLGYEGQEMAEQIPIPIPPPVQQQHPIPPPPPPPMQQPKRTTRTIKKVIKK